MKRESSKFTHNFDYAVLFPIVFLISKLALQNIVDGRIFTNLINPLVLLLMAIFFGFYTKNYHGRFVRVRDHLKLLIILALAYLVLNMLSGLILGYSYNPYSIHILAFLSNIWQIVIPLISIEYMRSAVINKNPKSLSYVCVFTLVFTLLEINFYTFANSFESFEICFKYVASVIVPILCHNILFSYLITKVSCWPIIVYRAITEIALLVVPIIPSLDWYMLGIRAIIAALLTIFIFGYFTKDVDDARRAVRVRRVKNTLSYIPALIITIILALFVSNNLMYAPVSILSNSMGPVFSRGDIVIYEQKTPEIVKNLEENDIIVYNKNGQIVVHRIINKYTENGLYYYITKGDANNTRDLEPVSENSVMGVYKTSLAKVGWPSIWLREAFNNNEVPEVEIK